MLPDFPKLKERLLRLAQLNYRQQVEADELIGGIPATPYFEGSRFAAGDVDGHVEESTAEMMEIPFEIERSAIIERGIAAFVECLEKTAEIQVQAMHKMLFRKHGEATARVGNQIDATGQPFSADLYFKLLETVQLDHFVDACLFPSQLLTFEMLRRPLEFTLTASVRMMNDPVRRALRHGHLQRLNDQLGGQVIRRRPAHNPPAEHVENDGQIQEADERRHVGVSSPEESHLQALLKPDVNLSAHPAPIVPTDGTKPARQGGNKPGWRCATPPTQWSERRR